MKKAYILTISMLLISSSNLIIAQSGATNSSDENSSISNPADNTNINSSSAAGENTTKNINNSNSEDQNESNCQDIDDPYDNFVTEAEKNGLEVQPMAKPSYLMSIVQKLGIIFFLNPYIFVVDNYRLSKDFVIKYATISWEAIVGKKPEEETNGTVKK